MLNTKVSVFVAGIAVGFILHVVVVNLAGQNGTESVDVKLEYILDMLKNKNNCPKCMCLDFETRKRQAAEELMNENVKQDDPRLIKLIQDYFVEQPPNTHLRNSQGLVMTPHAEKVLQILKNKTGGFFVESGAMDGETTSNTIYLEQRMNWTGLLIEMDPALYLQVKGKSRKSVLINACISPAKHPITAGIVDQAWSAATKISVGSRKLPNNNPRAYCFPFYSFMLAIGRSEIDYFSLDIEGVEYDALSHIPFDKLNIKVLSVEYAHAKVEKEDFVKLMAEKGYKVHTDLMKCKLFCRDFIFVKNDM